MTVLNSAFVENRASPLTSVPVDWNAGLNSGIKLNFKMCQIRKLHFDFTWDRERYVKTMKSLIEYPFLPLFFRDAPKKYSSVTKTPSRILVIDLSLNELQTIDHEPFENFRNLKVLDISTNRLES